jgi:zinc protease
MTRIGFAVAVALLGALPAGAQEFPRTPPPPGPLTPAPFPPLQEATLPNGLRVLVVENRQQPVVSLSLSFSAGSVQDPADREGLAAMVAGLLTKGAGDRTAEQFSEAIEGVGGALSASAGADFLTVTATVLTPDVELMFDLVADAVMRPTFPDDEVSLLRTQTLSGLQVELSQPGQIATRMFRQAVYGNHPYGRSPTPASVRAITREDITAFHAAHLKPSGALLVLAGDINLDEARRQAMRAFRGWLGTPPQAARVPAPPVRTGSELLLVHRPGSVQSNIVVGNLSYEPTEPRRYAAALANKVLGGGADSRLFLILREEKSWTYGAYSSFAPRRGPGLFNASAEVRTEVTDSALAEMLVQLRRIGSEPVPEAEFEAAKSALVGSYPLSIETASQVASAVANARLYGLPPDYVQTYRVRLGQVTPREAMEAARAFIRPDAAAIVVVGDGQKVYERIRDVAPIRVVDPEGRPLTPEDLVPRVTALPLRLDRLAARSDSFAVMVQGNPFGSVSDTLERDASGFRYREATRIGGFVEQDTDLRLNAALEPLEVRQSGRIQGMETTIHVTFANGRAQGSATTPDPATGALRTVAIDTVVPPGVIEENLLSVIIPALDWTDDARHIVSVFSSSTGEVHTVTLAVSGREVASTPAGDAECWVIQATGGPQAVTLYATTAPPYRVMKIAIVGTPVEMVRVR